MNTHTHTPGLGNTVSEIDVSKARVFSKTVFSMVIPDVEDILKQDVNRKSVVLFGIEVQTTQNHGGRKEERRVGGALRKRVHWVLNFFTNDTKMNYVSLRHKCVCSRQPWTC